MRCKVIMICGVLFLGIPFILNATTCIFPIENIHHPDLILLAQLTDADEDGMDDDWEIMYGLNPSLDDSNLDLDGDGLTNYEEYIHLTNPSRVDTDFDSLPDGWEVQYGLNPLSSSDKFKDPDNDDLNNFQEYFYGSLPNTNDSDSDTLDDYLECVYYQTNPMSNDTDSDGLPDPYEVAYDLDPHENDAAMDIDNDGLTNIEEYVAGTNPRKLDTDEDGIGDGAEIAAGLDPLVPGDQVMLVEFLQNNMSIIVTASLCIFSIIILAIRTRVDTIIEHRQAQNLRITGDQKTGDE